MTTRRTQASVRPGVRKPTSKHSKPRAIVRRSRRSSFPEFVLEPLPGKVSITRNRSCSDSHALAALFTRHSFEYPQLHHGSQFRIDGRKTVESLFQLCEGFRARYSCIG